MSAVIQNSMVAQISSIASGSNMITVQDSDGVKMSVIDQEVLVDSVSKAVITQAMESDVGQSISVTIDQAAKAKAEGFEFTWAMMLIIALVVVGGVVIIKMKKTVENVIMSPLTWTLIVTPFLIGAVVLAVAGIPQKKTFWPYKNMREDDNEDEKDSKKAFNKTLLLGSAISAAMLAVICGGLLFAVVKTSAGSSKRSGGGGVDLFADM